MNSLRDAAQAALEALGLAKLNGKSGLHPAEIGEIADAITALRAALAQQAEPVQEPVAWMDIDSDGNRLSVRQWSDGNRDEVPLYTAPPQRQPLTDEEIKACEKQALVDGALPHEQRLLFARAIERAHGIPMPDEP